VRKSDSVEERIWAVDNSLPTKVPVIFASCCEARVHFHNLRASVKVSVLLFIIIAF
jgi:hypothetical protein